MKMEIYFAVPQTVTAQARAWQLAANQMLIKGQIEKRGQAIVIRYREHNMLRQIDFTPELGEAEPWFGDFGGGYAFLFEPQNHGCILTIECLANGNPRFGGVEVEPFKMLLPIMPVVQPMRSEQERWFRPRIVGENARSEISVPKLEFWIDGEMYEKLLASGWDEAQLWQHRYRFLPLSVGCEVYVVHLNSGKLMHLTKGMEW